MRRIDSPDTNADIQLRECLNSASLKSFIMIAGAGSGKTTSLIKALTHLIQTRGTTFQKRNQKVACITYTDVAAKEIWQDVGNNPLVHVSTIHSFLWEIVSSFQSDIKKWVINNIDSKLIDLRNEALNFGGRVQERTREKNRKEILKFEAQSTVISSVKNFNYGTGSRYDKGILGHDDIIKMVTHLIRERPLLQLIITQKFPFIFVDESQDTFPDIVNCLKEIDRNHTTNFCLGFFGDPMQKIYATGVGNIQAEENWEQITKEENFRSSQKVLSLINAIRLTGDGLQQRSGRIDENQNNLAPIGSARIFIMPIDDERVQRLNTIREWTARKNNDAIWNNLTDKLSVKILVIVHRMAANRLGFANLYEALNDNNPSDGLKAGFVDGTAWPIKIFRKSLLPIITYMTKGDQFEVMQILRDRCPIFSKERINKDNAVSTLNSLHSKLQLLKNLFESNANSTIGDVLQYVYENNLFELDERFNVYLRQQESNHESIIENLGNPTNVNDDESRDDASIRAYLRCPVKELSGYNTYIEDESPFSTQHGIKGTEFDRVLTILDDDEGTHPHFSYNKYFGLTPLSKADQQKISSGEETSIERTRRLFYVCCSRAMIDLVAVYFTENPASALETIRNLNIFEPENIITLENLLQDNLD